MQCIRSWHFFVFTLKDSKQSESSKWVSQLKSVDIFLDHTLKGNKQSESRKWVSQLVNDKYIERGTSLIKKSNKS